MGRILNKIGRQTWLSIRLLFVFSYFPAIEAGVNVIPEKLQIFVGLGGGIHRNSFRSLATQNPFISTYVPLSFSNQKFKVDGGVNANIIDNLSISADVTYSVFDDYSMFINNYLGTTPVIHLQP